MIEFRLHEGRTQYRTWVISIGEYNVLEARYNYAPGGHDRSIDWTEWMDVPVAPK